MSDDKDILFEEFVELESASEICLQVKEFCVGDPEETQEIKTSLNVSFCGHEATIWSEIGFFATAKDIDLIGMHLIQLAKFLKTKNTKKTK